jgi:outer membrane protein OmpA-like peptidoglycan-associated protein
MAKQEAEAAAAKAAADQAVADAAKTGDAAAMAAAEAAKEAANAKAAADAAAAELAAKEKVEAAKKEAEMAAAKKAEEEKAAAEAAAAAAAAETEVRKPVMVEEKVEFAVNNGIRADVLTRIEEVPDITDKQRTQLKDAVQTARQIGLLMTVNYATAGRALSSQDISEIKAAFDRPEVNKLASDFTTVFFVVGYADVTGNPDFNKTLSGDRAKAVVDVMRNELKIKRAIHPVPMGGTELLSTENKDKNRAAEVWIVQQ